MSASDNRTDHFGNPWQASATTVERVTGLYRNFSAERSLGVEAFLEVVATMVEENQRLKEENERAAQRLNVIVRVDSDPTNVANMSTIQEMTVNALVGYLKENKGKMIDIEYRGEK